MGWIAACAYRPEFDRYATTKSGGQLLLSAGFLADSVTELVDVHKAGPGGEHYYYALLGILAVTLTLNLVGMVLSLILALRRYPVARTPSAVGPPGGALTCELDSAVPLHCPRSLRLMNEAMAVITALVFVLVATKTSIREGRSGFFQRCVNCTFSRGEFHTGNLNHQLP